MNNLRNTKSHPQLLTVFIALALAIAMACLIPLLGVGAYAVASGTGTDLVAATKGKAIEVQAKTKASTKVTPAFATGYYTLYSKTSGSKLAVTLMKASAAQNVGARTGKPTKSLYQRLCLRHLGNNIYTIQIGNTGKYLTDKKGRVVQQAFKPTAKKNVPAKAQRWRVIKKKSGAAFINVATGKALTAAGKGKKGCRLTTATYKKSLSQRFYGERLKKLIPNGTYTIATNSAKLRLDVDGASWDAGANVQVWKASKSLAQRFALKYAGGGYYYIHMAVSGKVVQSKSAGKGKVANVCMAAFKKGSSKQLWRPSVGQNGVVFKNKSTGCVLSISGKPGAGANVRTAKSADKPTQGWRLTKTPTIDRGSLDVLRDIVGHVEDEGNRTLVFDPKGTGFTVSDGKRENLEGALGSAWDRGEDVSFVMVDLKTGATLSMGADRDNHGASAFKAAYVTYIFQDLVETGEESYGSISGDAWETISYSNNDTYLALRSRFGSGGFSDWLEDVGLGWKASQPYPALTARDLANIWAKIYSYQNSDGEYVGRWRDMFDHSYYSAIQERLGDSKTVYSKPGWYPQEGRYAALNDGAIVKGDNGTYLLAIISNVECYSERWIVRDVVEALDDIYNEWY